MPIKGLRKMDRRRAEKKPILRSLPAPATMKEAMAQKIKTSAVIGKDWFCRKYILFPAFPLIPLFLVLTFQYRIEAKKVLYIHPARIGPG